MLSKQARLTRTVERWLLFAAALVLCEQALATQPQVNIEEAIAPYPRAEVVERTQTMVADYRLALGEMRKIRSVWAPEKEQWEAGELHRVTMQIPNGHTAREAYRFYRNRFANIGARALFLCEQRNCGSSNSWANEVFEIKQLYGLDQDQYYGIFEVINDRDQINYLSVYTVTRGNRRVYAHVELLRTNSVSSAAVAPSPRAILLEIQEQGYHIVSGIALSGNGDDETANGNRRDLDIQAEHLAALVEALRLDSRLSIRIVGHSYADVPLDEQIARSEAYAEQLGRALIDAGIQADRIDTHGVGSLAPQRRSSSDFRIEVLPRR